MFARRIRALAVMVAVGVSGGCVMPPGTAFPGMPPTSAPQSQPPVGYWGPSAPARATTPSTEILRAYTQLSGAYHLLADLVQRDRIAKDDARMMLAHLDIIRESTESAATVNDPNQWRALTAGLVAIETVLKQRAGQDRPAPERTSQERAAHERERALESLGLGTRK